MDDFKNISQPEELEQAESKMSSYYMHDIGVTGLNRWGNSVDEEILPQLKWPSAGKIYREMSDNDPTIGAVMYMSKQLIRKAGWTVEPYSDSPEHIADAQFLEECMNDMETSWDNVISEILSYFVYGWSFHEIVYKMRKGPAQRDKRYKSKYSDGKIGWRKLPVRAQNSLYGWVFDKDGDITGMIQQAPPDYHTITIPMSKGLLFRTESTANNPEGRSLLRNAYRPWYFKKRIEEIEGIGIERDLAGLPVLTPDENVDLWNPNDPESVMMRTMAENMVRNIRRDKAEGAVIPPGWELKLLSTGGSRQFDTNAIINRYDQRIAITLLADIVMLGADKVGSFALADVKKGLLAASLEAQNQIIADVFNSKAIPDLFEINDRNKDLMQLPKIIPGEIETPDMEELGKFFKAVGFDWKSDKELFNYIRQVAGMPTVDSETFEEILERTKQLPAEKPGPGRPIGSMEGDSKIPDDDTNISQ